VLHEKDSNIASITGGSCTALVSLIRRSVPSLARLYEIGICTSSMYLQNSRSHRRVEYLNPPKTTYVAIHKPPFVRQPCLEQAEDSDLVGRFRHSTGYVIILFYITYCY
jgi:hypothetical protein